MKVEWMVTYVTFAGSPDRGKCANFGGDFDWAFFWSIQATVVAGEPLSDARIPS